MMGNRTRQTPARPCPTVDQWAEALAATDLDPHRPSSAAHMTSELELHLEHCDPCRATLDYLASDATFADELQMRLSGDLPHVPKLGSKILALSGIDGTKQCAESNQQELEHLQQWLDPASHPELIGMLGRYELHQLVGRGGMGLVFRARDMELQRVVAVKTLTLHLASLAVARERFAREGRAIASLSHPHIVQVYDVVMDQRVPALVMQYVPGQTLEDRIESHGAIDVDDTLRIASQLLSALAAAHENGLVHRDIKPGNVLLEADGCRALLSDFGLVRALDDASLTHSGFLAGTPHYMSPEQARGATVDARSDLFSLGSLVYTMLAGHPPFRAPEPMAVLHRICNEPQRPLHQVDGRIPVELSRWVDRLLAKDTHRRFASATEARAALQSLALAPRRLLPALPSTALLSRKAAVVAAMAIVAVIGGGAFIWRPAKLPTRSETRVSQRQPLESGDSTSTSITNGPANEATKAATADAIPSTTAAYQQMLTAADGNLRQLTTFNDLDQRVQQLSIEIDHVHREAQTFQAPVNWPDLKSAINQISTELQQIQRQN